ncbi:autotransporter outer membrane beta-barrel domain-containing protein [Brucella sp. 10RB9214]|uniref:autotransporter outer membrane beta-barrel domain-containing protein n=1 Tax=Brucella sp. 09RB8910 TaxID=1844051 RepID=UPI000972C4BD|nr:autotransporter outer membrane beta-barrel domain-containing protein [Brucella sp. 09RB8910]APY15261.1 autotransporter outer membrane beta-barrel domain-containing protein [Brucella sp. 09RB8910]MRN47807.1 autotransporter outer membrane beta-barrel domain-containing protein [Brucella sp. 10RB9212]MRN50528.1 autotransporter outer membrane beta-barrel domain-containing protein [Brucella sp. 10RB9214]
MLVDEGGKVIETGTSKQAEAVNVFGAGNTVTNRGLIQSVSSAAIWFEHQVTGTRNVINNYGTIEKLGGSGSVIGSSGAAGIDFTNYGGAKVIGDLSFADGDDNLTFEPHSVVTGNINGGGGTNNLYLQGSAGSEDVLPGALSNFATLIKQGEGRWTAAGSLSVFETVTVENGTLALTGDNNGYTGNVIVKSQGVLEAQAKSLPTKADSNANVKNVVNDGILHFEQPDDGTYIGQITGSGTVEKTGNGVLTLAPAAPDGNTYTGGTTIHGGTIAVSADNGLGGPTGSLTFDSGILKLDKSFNLADTRAITLNAGGGTIDTNGNTTNVFQSITGAGALTKVGAGVLNLLGDNTYTGSTAVAAGTLYVNGDQSAATGVVSVQSGATIGGDGTIGGALNVFNAATLAPGRAGGIPGTLTIKNSLNLFDGSILEYSLGQANVVGGALNDHIVVDGNLVLGGGTINVETTQGGSFDPGIYRIISYTGTLYDNKLKVGRIPATNYYVQTSVAKQVNLVNTSGLTLNYWDGYAGPKNNGVVDGGAGTWQNSNGNDNWTTIDGTPNAPFSDGSFAIFMAKAGVVTVDKNPALGDVRVSGIQFASDGYIVQGGTIRMVTVPSTTIRVGDGTAVGAAFTATINSDLTGDTRLVKTDLGTLVLGGANSYTGGTSITGGTLQISANKNLGEAAGDLSINGGTLHTTADMEIDRATVLENLGATIETDDGTTLNHIANIDGPGSLTKTGNGTLALAGTNSYAGGTTIDGGTIEISHDANLGDVAGPLGINGGTLLTTADIDMGRTITIGVNDGTIDTSSNTTLTQNGNIDGDGALTKTGDGTLVLTGSGTYAGGSIIKEGTLQLGDGGTSGSITGDVANDGTLAFKHVDMFSFDGVISGNGDVRQLGEGITVFTHKSDYTGSTVVEAGTLAAGGEDIFSGASDFNVLADGTLALNGFSQTLKSLTNAGNVDLGRNADTTLTVEGNYVGTGGTVMIGTVLGDDTSQTDKLVIAGDAVGNGVLAVRNVGGTGAQTSEGIKIVEVGGASDATFTLRGDYEFQGKPAVVGGAYAYQLYKNGKSTPTDGDWYLRSELIAPVIKPPLYQAGIASYETYPQALLGLNSLPTLQQRVGNRYWSGRGNRLIAQGADPIGTPYAAPKEAGITTEGDAVWGRIEGSHNRMEPQTSISGTTYDENILKLQAGLDGLFAENENGKLIGSMTLQYVRGKTKTYSVHGDGEISTDGYGFGGALTWYGDNGFYLDGQGQVTWYRSDLDSLLASTNLVSGNDGFGYALSVEGGKHIALGSAWSLTPQAQLVYSNVDFDDFIDVFGAHVSLDKGDSLQGRLGLILDHENSWQNTNGMLNRMHVYGIANLYYEFLGGTKVDVAGTSFASRNDRVWGGIGIGGSYNWNDDKYSIYGESLVNTSLNNFADSYSIKGQLGFRVKW